MPIEDSITLSIVVSCYNEEKVIPSFYKETMEVISKLRKTYLNFNHELIFIDDGSTDQTLNVLKSYGGGGLHYISFSRNFGKEAAIFAGLQKARGDFVVIMDVDLQDPPSLIPQMFDAVSSGDYDCARAKRITRKGETVVKTVLSKLFYKLMSKITDVIIDDGSRDFALMNRKYVDAILKISEKVRFSKGIFSWVGFKTKSFGYENIERAEGATKWSLSKLFFYALDGIMAFSSKPLYICFVFSCLLFAVTLFLIIFIIVRRLVFGDPVSGWASTICVILFCGSIQLLTVGILGQYLSRVYTEVKDRPLYIVNEEE